ncbi:hypothetical protein KG091_07885 [Carnobacteriaceae bacterium zg-ZUI78]|nr:hypothetical protein [Carnobacteriaceae bacterium zg-ZUI78]
MNPQDTFNELIDSIANRTAEKILEAVKRNDRNTWYTQQELMKEENLSWQEVKRMENYGLKSLKQGKYKKYCLADVNEIRHLMKS